MGIDIMRNISTVNFIFYKRVNHLNLRRVKVWSLQF